MNLLCRIDHLHGQHLLVDGHRYFIGDNGICTDVADHHARTLLAQKDTWVQVHPDDFARVCDAPTDPTDPRQQHADIDPLILPLGTELSLRKDKAEIKVHLPGRRGGKPKRGKS